MINSTLCYIETADSYLMLHRVKKENDMNKDKWIGIGGKFEDRESPEECLLREAKEETGLTLTEFRYRGIVTFDNDLYDIEFMHLFTCTGWEGEIGDCDEGELVWVKKTDIEALNLWEGDKIFFRLLEQDTGFFSLKLTYHGDELVSSQVHVY